jgi:hypothetical protein
LPSVSIHERAKLNDNKKISKYIAAKIKNSLMRFEEALVVDVVVEKLPLHFRNLMES